MFVSANRIKFTSSAIKNLIAGDKVNIDSCMGGAYTMTVKTVNVDGFTVDKKECLPSYYNGASFTWEEAEKDLFLLIPSTEYGVAQKHINVAIKAGYLTIESIAKVIAATSSGINEISESLAKHYIIKECLVLQ